MLGSRSHDDGAPCASEPRGRPALRGAAWTLVCNGLTLLVTTAAGVYLVRALGVSGRGEVAAAILVPTIFAYGGWLGLPVATGYWVSANPERRASLVPTARTLAVGISLILGLVSLLISAVAPVSASVRTASMLFALFIPLILFVSVHQAVLQAEQRTKAFNLSRLSGAVAYLVLLAAIDAFSQLTPLRAVLIQLVSIAIWLVLTSSLTAARPWFGFDRETARGLLGYGVRAHLGSMSVVDALRVDQLILAAFLSTYSLGLYVIAMTFVTANRVIGISLGTVALPLAARTATGERSATGLRALVVATAVLAVIAAALEILLGRWLLRVLFDVEIDEAYSVLAILAAGSIFMNLRQVCSDILRGLGRPGIPSISEVISLAAVCGLALAFWSEGLVGVAWAVTLAAVVSTLFAVLVGFALPSVTVSGASPPPARDPFRRRWQSAQPAAVGLATTGAAAGIGVGLAQVSVGITIGLVGLIAVVVVTVLILAWRGTRELASVALSAAALTVGMNGVRLTTSIALSDLFFLAAAGLLLPSVIFPEGQRRLEAAGPLLRGAVLVILGGIAGSMFAANPVGSLAQLIRFMVAAMVVPVIFALWKPSLAEIRRIAWLWTLSVSASAMIAIRESGSFYQGRADGLTNHPNHLALTCVMAIGPALTLTLLARGVGRWFGLGCCAALAGALLVSGSRAGIIGCAMALLTLTILSRRAAIAGWITAAACASLLVLASGVVPLPSGNAFARLLGSEDRTVTQGAANSDADRLERLRTALDHALSNPVTGHGFEDALIAHNILLQIVVSAGVLGLIGFIVIIAAVLKPAYRCFVSRAPSSDPAVLLLFGFSASYIGYLTTGMLANALWDRYIWLTPSIILVLAPYALKRASVPVAVQRARLAVHRLPLAPVQAQQT